LRLTPRGRAVGLIDDDRWAKFAARSARFDSNFQTLKRTLVPNATGDRIAAAQLLRQPEVRLETLLKTDQVTLDIDRGAPTLDVVSVETALKYEGYLRRQEHEVERARRDERRRIPPDFPFERVPGLSREVIQRLSLVRPDTLGHALRIPGVTPAAVAVLSSFVGRLRPGL